MKIRCCLRSKSIQILYYVTTQQPKDDDQIIQMWNKSKPKQGYLKPGKPMNSIKQVCLKG